MDQPVLVEGERYWGHHPHLPVVIGRVYARNDDRQAASDDFTGICHTHDHPELVIVYGGAAQHNLEGQDYPISAGDVFCILGNQAHYYHTMNRLKLLNVMYDPLGAGLPLGLLEKVPGYNALFKLEPNYRQQHQFSSRLTLEPAELAQVVNLAESMYAEIDRQPDGYEASTFAGLIRLILYLSRHYGEHSSKEAGALLRVSSVLVALEQDPRHPWTLEDMAELANVSAVSLVRTFKQATGLPPLKYLIQLRIRQSMELLAGTKMTITQIAAETGFNDSNYFARQFKQINGISATEFREQEQL